MPNTPPCWKFVHCMSLFKCMEPTWQKKSWFKDSNYCGRSSSLQYSCCLSYSIHWIIVVMCSNREKQVLTVALHELRVLSNLSRWYNSMRHIPPDGSNWSTAAENLRCYGLRADLTNSTSRLPTNQPLSRAIEITWSRGGRRMSSAGETWSWPTNSKQSASDSPQKISTLEYSS